MEAKPQTIQEYLDVNGTCPFREWLRALKDVTARAKIRARLNWVRLGNFGDCQPVGNEVYELRINFGPGYRAYFAHDGNRLVILLCGGDKKSQRKDIDAAKAYWQDYQNRRTTSP